MTPAKPFSPTIMAALGVALGLAVLSVFVFDALGGPQHFRQLIEQAGPWAPLVFMLLKISTYIFAPLSGTPLKLIAGAAFGLWEGFAYTLVADVIGASANFWIARLLRDRAVARLAGPAALRKIDDIMEHVGGWKALAAARFVLASVYDFISYAAGLSKLRFRTFFLVTFLVGMPATFVGVFVGDAIVTNRPLFFALIGLAIVALAIQALQHRHRKK
jgi:uncharacterized membrane protein YdjX (TVP38/TMEM64 family)